MASFLQIKHSLIVHSMILFIISSLSDCFNANKFPANLRLSLAVFQFVDKLYKALPFLQFLGNLIIRKFSALLVCLMSVCGLKSSFIAAGWYFEYNSFLLLKTNLSASTLYKFLTGTTSANLKSLPVCAPILSSL